MECDRIEVVHPSQLTKSPLPGLLHHSLTVFEKVHGPIGKRAESPTNNVFTVHWIVPVVIFAAVVAYDNVAKVFTVKVIDGLSMAFHELLVFLITFVLVLLPDRNWGSIGS